MRSRGFLLSFGFGAVIQDEEAYVKARIDNHLEYVEKKLDLSVYKVDRVGYWSWGSCVACCRSGCDSYQDHKTSDRRCDHKVERESELPG